MERVEWLAVEILSLMRDLLRTGHSEYASSLEDELQESADNISLRITWSPHKMEFDGYQMRSTMSGANDRADFS